MGKNLCEQPSRKASKARPLLFEKYSATFRRLCADLELSHDDFIRTSEPRHASTCGEMYHRNQRKGFYYFDRYEGPYCFSCEAFYTEGQAAEGGCCPQHGTPLETLAEDGISLSSAPLRRLYSLIFQKSGLCFLRQLGQKF